MGETYMYNFHEVLQRMHSVFLWIESDRCNANSGTINSDIHTAKLIFCSLQCVLDISFTGNLNINKYRYKPVNSLGCIIHSYIITAKF